MDLRDYADIKPGEKPQAEASTPQEADIRNAIGHFSKMSNDQLMVELAKQLNTQREKGNAPHIQQTLERIKPLLNDEQKQRMEEILKNVWQ